MQCPKCKGTYLQIYGSFDGYQKIEFKPEDPVNDGDLLVVDSEPGDFEWDDHDQVCCLDCGHQDSAVNFTAKKED